MTLKKSLFKYVSASVMSMLIFSFYTMADGFFVSRGVGELALAGVNLASPFTQLIFAVGLMFSIGTSIVISICFGEGRDEKANNYFNQNLFVVGTAAILLTILVRCNLDRTASLLGASGETFSYTRDYVGIIALFAFFFMISYNLEVLVKTGGAPLISTVGVSSCGCMNVLLDYLFVMRFGWGVKGAAFATGLSQVLSTCIFAVYFLWKIKRLRFGTFRFDLGIYKRIIPGGLSDGITELSTGVSAFVFNRAIVRVIGDQGLVAFSVITYVNTVIVMTMTGISQGLQPLVSFYYGKKEEKNYKTLLKYAFTAQVIISLAAFLGVFFFAPGCVGIFVQRGHKELFEYCVSALKQYGAVFLLLGTNIVLAGYFAAVARPAYSLTISLSRGLICNTICVLVMAWALGDRGIWSAVTVSESMTLGLTLVLWRKYVRLGGRWKEGV